MFRQRARGPGVDIADETDFQWDSLVQDVLREVAQFNRLPVGHGDVINEPGSVPDAVRAAILDALPDGFFSQAFAGMNGDVEILALNIVEGLDVLLGRISTLLACQIKSNNAPLAEAEYQFRHF